MTERGREKERWGRGKERENRREEAEGERGQAGCLGSYDHAQLERQVSAARPTSVP